MSHPVSRAARRALARKHGDRKIDPTYRGYAEKNWKLVYLRSNKLHRARQIGKIWPYREWCALMSEVQPVKILFVCSRNQWRSPTGEAVLRTVEGVITRSAGTSPNARRKITLADIRWADLILVMEDKHKSRIRAEFRQDIRHKAIHVLDIPDDYQYMDKDLADLIWEKVKPLIFNNKSF